MVMVKFDISLLDSFQAKLRTRTVKLESVEKFCLSHQIR